ncbi:hypothetical protein QVD17_23482 [Tagetes erecta]|uniref:Dolichyl-diphosphooligosaccharide--protein glycosyltransferase subunit 4 n=1 Tax=Tagetes erecta TaxID=13708 RepID=A0AAD8KE61_TARER|nr:hypothetical protein QVD17_23482 [Tagetes erecta]
MYRYYTCKFTSVFTVTTHQPPLTRSVLLQQSPKMITDNDLGFIANFLGIFIFALVIAYHYVLADPKYEGN